MDTPLSVIIRGCNIGQSHDFLNLFFKALGGKSPVAAPTHKQSYLWDVSSGKTWEYFHTYWLQYKGFVKKKRSQLIKDFKAKYPELEVNQWMTYVKKRKRTINKLPTNPPLVFRSHPPHLNPDACLKFVKKHWKGLFKREKVIPAKFIRREGPKNETSPEGETFKAYVYCFDAKIYDTITKSRVEVFYPLTVKVHPDDATLIAEEKMWHPNINWYHWSVSRKKIKKGRFTRIQVKAVRTLYQIRKPIIDDSGKYLEVEATNRKYWGWFPPRR